MEVCPPASEEKGVVLRNGPHCFSRFIFFVQTSNRSCMGNINLATTKDKDVSILYIYIIIYIIIYIPWRSKTFGNPRDLH